MNSYSVAERINSDVNASVKYKTDLGQYNVPEFWTVAVSTVTVKIMHYSSETPC